MPLLKSILTIILIGSMAGGAWVVYKEEGSYGLAGFGAFYGLLTGALLDFFLYSIWTKV